MNYPPLHAWDLSPAAARQLQRELATRLLLAPMQQPIRSVAGLDVGFEDGGRVTRAAVVVLDAASLEPLEQALVRQPTRFPYISGLLSFREAPALIAALERLHRPPDLLVCDGQGTAHPRRFGIACHVGLWTGIPALGVAKSRLCGSHAGLAPYKGAWVPLRDKEDVIGAVLRTRQGVNPVYVSPGHRMDLTTAIAWTLRLSPRYRLPETTRRAHHLASVAKAEAPPVA